MNVKTLKYISIPIILIVNFIVGTIPYFLISKRIKRSNWRKSSVSSNTNESIFVSPVMKKFLTLANFFCGGVFLSTSLVGLYPSVNNKFNDILRKQPSIPDYPYAGLSLAGGFFFVWVLEILVHACLHFRGHSHQHDHSSKHSVENNDVPTIQNLIKETSFNHPDHEHSPNFSDDQITQPKPSDRLLNTEDNVDEHYQITESVQVNTGKSVHEAHSHVPIKGNLLGSIMLTFALGSHSIIEGLGFAMIGEFSMTINMLITVLIHESVCALSLGVNLASKKTPIHASVLLLLTFAALIPVGIGLGMVVNLGVDKNLVGDLITAVFQGVAAGTFIYVVFMEILPAEMMEHKDDALKIFMMIIGFAVIAAMKIFHIHGDKTNLPSNCTVDNSSFPTNVPVHIH